MQENLAFLQIAKKPNAKNRKITEAILKVQDSLNKNNIGVQEKDIDMSLSQIWDFLFTLIQSNSLSIQNSVERCTSIFILRVYSFYPEKIERLLINQIKLRKKYSMKKDKSIESNQANQTTDLGSPDIDSKDSDTSNENNSNTTNENINYDPLLAKFDNLLLQIFTYISPKISSMRVDSFLDNCKENGIFSLFTMKGNQTISNTVPKYLPNLKSLGIDWHIDLLSSFLSEKVDYAQIKSINAIIDNYPSLFRRVLSTDNFSLISYILSIHNNSNEALNSSITGCYFSNLNNFPRTDEIIDLLFQSTTVTDIDNFLMFLSCDKDVKIIIESKAESSSGKEEEEADEEDEEENENEIRNNLNIESKIVKFYNFSTKFSQSMPLSQVINRSSFYNFADIPFKYLVPRDDDSVFILTVKFQKIAQRATLKNCKKIFSIFNHFLNERQSQIEKEEAENELVKSSSFYDELTSACLQNLPICINIFSVLPEFPNFLKRVLLVKPASWLHASDISKILGSLNSVHFNQIGGLTAVITKLLQFSMSSNKQLSNNAIESIVRISNINNSDLILQVIYNSFDDFDSHNVAVNLRIISKIVEKNKFYFCILTTFLERVLEDSIVFQDDLFLLSEVLHYIATIKSKTKLPSYSSNSYIIDDSKSNDTYRHNVFGYGKKMKYLKEVALSLIYSYIQFFIGSSNFRPPQSNNVLIDNLYSLIQDYVNSSDFDQINFTFLFNAFDFLKAYPSTNYKTLSLLLCDDLINIFPIEVSEFTVNYARNALTQSFYKAFDYFSNSKDIEVAAIWCYKYIKIIENSAENSVNKQMDDKVDPVFEKMADFAFSNPTKVSKNCLNAMSLYLLKFCPIKTKLSTLIDSLNNKEAKQSTLLFLYKEDEVEFNFAFPNMKPIKGSKFQFNEGEKSSSNKRKSNLSDEYSDDEEDEDDEFDLDHVADLDSDSFSDKSQQDEFAFTFNKVLYNDLLNNYLNYENKEKKEDETKDETKDETNNETNNETKDETKDETNNETNDETKDETKDKKEDEFKEFDLVSKNYLIQTQMKYSLIDFTIDQLKELFNRYFELCDYESLFNLIIYCMRYHRDFPFSEYSSQFSITPFKNLSIFLSQLDKSNKRQKDNLNKGIPVSVVSLTSAYLMNEHINDNEKDEECKKTGIFDQFLYYYDRFMLSYDDQDSQFSILKEVKSIDYLSTNTNESSTSNSSKSPNNSNDRNNQSKNKNFSIPYLYEENEFDIDSFSRITSADSATSKHYFSPLPTADSYTYSSINLKMNLIKRILELLSLSTTIEKATKDEKISKKTFRRILSCIPFVNKPFLSEGIDFLEFSLILVSKVEKLIHWKFALLVLANVAMQMESPKREGTSLDESESGNNVVKKSESKEKITAFKPFEKNFTINDSFISSLYSIYCDNTELIPRDEFILCLRSIIERTICQDDSKLHDLLKIINSNQREYISPSGLNVFISNINFSIKFENVDVSGLCTKLFSFKGIPSFFIRGCSLIFQLVSKGIPIKNPCQLIFEARKEFFNGMIDGINALLNIFSDFDSSLSTSAIEMAHKIQKLYASQESLLKGSESDSSSQSQPNQKKGTQQTPNQNQPSESNIKYNSQACTCNFFIDRAFYSCSLLVLTCPTPNQANITYLAKQHDVFIIDPHRAEFNLSSKVLPHLIKKLNASQPSVKKIQCYVSSFILPKHIAMVNYHHNISDVTKYTQKKRDEKREEDDAYEDEVTINPMNSFDIGGFDIIATSILPVYLKCIIEIYKVVPDNVNNPSSRITNSLLELFHACKDFDCYCFSDFIWKWNVLIAEHSTSENALNLSCTTFPNVLPRFFPLFVAIVKFVKGHRRVVEGEAKDNDDVEKELFKNYLTSASLISHEKSKAHGLAFSLLADEDDRKIKDALDLAQFDRDCRESDSLIKYINDQKLKGT